MKARITDDFSHYNEIGRSLDITVFMIGSEYTIVEVRSFYCGNSLALRMCSLNKMPMCSNVLYEL